MEVFRCFCAAPGSAVVASSWGMAEGGRGPREMQRMRRGSRGRARGGGGAKQMAICARSPLHVSGSLACKGLVKGKIVMVQEEEQEEAQEELGAGPGPAGAAHEQDQDG